MRNLIERAMRRPWRYWFEDGLPEIGLGAMSMLMGLAFLIEAMVPAGPWSALAGTLGTLVAILGGGRLAGWAIRAAKERLTYPRTGYVAYRREPRGRRFTQRAALGAALGAIVGALASLPALHAFIPALIGASIGAVLLYGGYRFDLTRFYLLATASVVSGTLVAIAGLGEAVGGAVYFGSLGLALVLSGALALYNYLRATRSLVAADGHGD